MRLADSVGTASECAKILANISCLVNLYSREDCTTIDGGQVISVPAEHTQCYTGQIGSAQFGEVFDGPWPTSK